MCEVKVGSYLAIIIHRDPAILNSHLSDDGEETTTWENEFLKDPEVSTNSQTFPEDINC